MSVRAIAISLAAATLLACGSGETGTHARQGGEAAAQPAAVPASAEPDAFPAGIVLSLAQFEQKDGKPVPGPARLEFLYRQDGAWRTTAIEDPESNVFHKAMFYEGAEGPRLLTAGGTAAIVKTWRRGAAGLEARTEWRKDFGGKWSRIRDAEVADLYGDGGASIAVATHDQGVVAVLRPRASAEQGGAAAAQRAEGERSQEGGFDVLEIDENPETFVHEIEIGDLDGDRVLEVYATPSEPNRLDGTPQSGQVVRYVPARQEGRVVVADLGERHAKEILVDDVDGDGRDELYVSVEGRLGGAGGKQLLERVEIRRYEADTPAAEGGVVVASIEDHLCRFLSAGDVDGDGRKELVAAAFSSGVWLLRPGADPKGSWEIEQVDADSGGFEHAAILTDLDGDGRDELYVASDRHKELRRYVWNGERPTPSTCALTTDPSSPGTWLAARRLRRLAGRPAWT
jgi:hypothetical protein